jgi:outer membrane immunogenic protein
MKYLRYLGAIAAVALLSYGSASAADLAYRKAPPVVTYPEAQALFGGLTIGINGGYGWNKVDTTNQSINTTGGLVGLPNGTFPATTFTGANSTGNMDGAFFGGQVGYAWQQGNVVFGIETDFQWADFKTSNQFSGSLLGPVYNTSSKIDAFGTSRLKLGYAMGSFMPYVTGGVAYANIRSDLNVQPGALGAPVGAAFNQSNESWQVGYVVGGGIQYAVTQNWLLGVEYKHMEFASRTYNFNFNAAGAARADAGVKSDLVSLTLNYKLPVGF